MNLPADIGERQLELRLLGGCELLVDGEPCDATGWRRRTKPRVLVKYLALQPGRSAHRERLIDLLWPDAEAAAGLNNFHQAMHMLRNAVGSPLVEQRGQMVSLALGVRTDVDAFRDAAEAARRSGERCDYEAALALYRGELLPEDAYAEWTTAARDDVARRRRQLLVESAEQLSAEHAWTDAEARLRDAIETDPLDDGLRRRLADVLIAADQPRRALMECRSYSALLRRELGVEPAEEFASLESDLARTMEARDAARAGDPLDVRYTTSRDGTRIAYAVHEGAGGIPLVVMPQLPWGHLQVEWEIPGWRELIERLGHRRMVVRYNLRGTGPSPMEVTDICLDRQVEDLAAVVDATGLGEVALFAGESAGPVALLYAAREPDRVRDLILSYAWADGARYTALMGGIGVRQLIQGDWDRYLTMAARTSCGWDPNAEAHARRWFTMSTSREMLLRYWDMITAVDVTPCLAKIRARAVALWKPDVVGADPELFRALTQEVLATLGGAMIPIGGEAYHWAFGDTEPLAAAIDAFLDEPDGAAAT